MAVDMNRPGALGSFESVQHCTNRTLKDALRSLGKDPHHELEKLRETQSPRAAQAGLKGLLRSLIDCSPLFYAVTQRLTVTQSQKHLRWTMLGPTSLYSSLVIHISWNVERDASIEPPTNWLTARSGLATTFTLIALGANW